MDINTHLVVALQKLFITLSKSAGQNLHSLGITGSEFIIMTHLNVCASESVQKLAEVAMISSGTATYTINKLEKRNYVTRKQDLADRRIFRVIITPEGKDYIMKILGPHMHYMEWLLGDFSNDQKKEFIDKIKYFGKTIEKKEIEK